jgi:hypothetical protein
VRLISESSRKDDRLDARTLGRLARIDPALLGPVRHRSAKAQIHLTVIRARTALVNAARGLTKSYGARLRKCGTAQMNREMTKGLQPELREALDPLLAEIESLNERIAEYETTPSYFCVLGILHLLFEGRAECFEIRYQKPDVATHYAEMGNLLSLDPKIHSLRTHTKKFGGLSNGQRIGVTRRRARASPRHTPAFVDWESRWNCYTC